MNITILLINEEVLTKFSAEWLSEQIIRSKIWAAIDKLHNVGR